MTKDLPAELSRLPTPQLIEPLSFSGIFTAMLADFQRRYPEYSALLASDPAIKLLEVAAYRELLLRHRINEAARANLLAFAAESDLDHLGAFYGVSRLAGETDTALRKRIQARIMGFANAGGATHYRYWALSASPEIADVAVDSPGPGRVRISVLPNRVDSEVSEQVLDAVRAVVLRDDIRVLTDTIEVVPVERIPVSIAARIWLYPDTPEQVFTSLQERLTQALQAEALLGWDLTCSWLIGQLQQPGVHKVELLNPTSDQRVAPKQAVVVHTVTLTLAGRDR